MSIRASSHEDVVTPRETVNHPAHYGGEGNPYEAIQVIEAWELGFCLGNTVKYIARAGRKGSQLEDLRKARWYLDREIERLTNQAQPSRAASNLPSPALPYPASPRRAVPDRV